MSTPTLNDLRRAYFGGGTSAERAFLEDAYASGLTAASPQIALTTVWIDAGQMFPATTGQFPNYGQLGLEFDHLTEEKAAMKFRPPAWWNTMDMYLHTYSSNATGGGVRWMFTDVYNGEHAISAEYEDFGPPYTMGLKRLLIAEDLFILSDEQYGTLGVQQGPIYRKVDHGDDDLEGPGVLWGVELVRKS